MMEIPSLSSLFTRAPGTPGSRIRPEANLTFEESNNAVDSALDRVDQTRETVESGQNAVRGVATDLIAQQTTRNNFETYVQVATASTEQTNLNTPETSPPTGLIDVADIREAQRQNFRNETREAISNNETAQDALQRRIDEITNPDRTEAFLVDIQV